MTPIKSKMANENPPRVIRDHEYLLTRSPPKNCQGKNMDKAYRVKYAASNDQHMHDRAETK